MVSISMNRNSAGQGAISVNGAYNLNINGIGQMNGSALFGLSATNDGSQTVHNIMQYDSAGSASFLMAGNNNNTRFSGYNMYAEFDSECALGYNVELDTINSMFDFSNTQSGAMISTTDQSAHNQVRLGGGNYVGYDMVEAQDSPTGEALTMGITNMVNDSGYSNVFLSTVGASSRFETTNKSRGAFIQGGEVFDKYMLNGSHTVVSGGNGYNIYDMSSTSYYNSVVGGLGTNIYDDKGTHNMYTGYGALYSGGVYGNDTVRFGGSYGIARTATNKGFDDVFQFNGGSYNAGFMSEEGKLADDTKINYRELLNGMNQKYSMGTGKSWLYSDFNSSSSSPAGYSAYLGYFIMQQQGIFE